MTKSGNKSIATTASVDAFIDSLDDERQIADSRQLLEIFGRVTKKIPVMWGDAMIGYGAHTIVYASGREVEWFVVGFSPHKGKISLYVTFDATKLTGQFPDLGKYKTGKGCVYVARLSDINLIELERLIGMAYELGWQDPVRDDKKESAARINRI